MQRVKSGSWFGLLAAYILLMVTACGTPGGRTTKKVFHLNISTGYLESLDPAAAKDLNMMWADHMIYNTLLETDSQLHTVPSLAKSWQVSADGLAYTFHLRSDVFFQDNEVFPGGRGRRFTASDVVYSFTRIMDAATASPGAWIFNNRVADTAPFAATDDTTFVLRLRSPFAPLPEMLSMAYCSIVPREAVEKWGRAFRSHPCGTGPFVMRNWDETNALNLLKNEHYWEHDNENKPLPYLDAVQVTFIDSRAQEFLLFLQGKVDFVNGVDGSFKDFLFRKDGQLKKEFGNRFGLTKSTYLNTEYLGFLTDTTHPVMHGQATANRLVRQAINYAIDRKKIVTYFKNGLEVPACKGFIPLGLPGYDPHARYGYDYDPEKARRLLAEAGHPGGNGLSRLKILVPNNFEDIVNFVASELKEVGIEADLELIQPNVLKQEMSRQHAVCFRAQWLADYPDAETYLVCFNSRFPAPPNYTRYSNPLLDSLYDRSMLLGDTARWALYTAMDSIAMQDAPVVPLYYEKLLHFTQNNITGLQSNPMNIIDLKRVRKL